MKILFLNPPDLNKVSEYALDEHSKEYIESDDFGAFPPLGLLYVMSYLEKSEPHHELFFKDCVAERVGHKALDEYIEKIKPDIGIVFGCRKISKDIIDSFSLYVDSIIDIFLLTEIFKIFVYYN